MKISAVLLCVIISCVFIQCSSVGSSNAQRANNPNINDSERFASEYPMVGNDNVFVYRNAEEIANILAHGTGIVYIGFKECPWCQTYAVFLNDAAREMGIEEIYYLDIREDRENNSESYQRIVNILDGHLQYDNEGRPRVYVPDLTIVNSGLIMFRDFETSYDTLGYRTPDEYWNDERVNSLLERFRAGFRNFNSIFNRQCNIC